MRILGLSHYSHDASVCVIDDGVVTFATHSERYSKHKNDAFLSRELLKEALDGKKPDVIAYYELNWLKRIRQFFSKNYNDAMAKGPHWYLHQIMPELKGIPIKSYPHHLTHAAAGTLTSDFDECAVVCIDSIGEYNTATIWHWDKNKLKIKHNVNYPNSLGLFYTAFTHHIGLKPLEDEYVLMGMAAYGEPIYKTILDIDIFKDEDCTNGATCLNTKVNLVKGVPNTYLQRDHLEKDEWGQTARDYDIAASVQAVAEERISKYVEYAKELTGSDNLVFMGGCALNCVANSNLYEHFKNIHIMPNPGDAGSSLGAAAWHNYLHTGNKIDFTPYLGYNIEGKYPVKKGLKSLLAGEIFGIANGKAEFGPRALGNRILCADPRGSAIKDAVNKIKRRQEFRPFAPIILEEYVHEYFEMPGGITNAPYMQYTAKCLKPDEFPAIVHADGTSRVQTVNKQQHPDLYKMMKAFHKETGCPMILNTSLNIKGMPIVNDLKDAKEFSKKYGVPVHTRD